MMEEQRSFAITLLDAGNIPISTVFVSAENVTGALCRATEIASEMAATDFYIKASRPKAALRRRPKSSLQSAAKVFPLGPYFTALLGLKWGHTDQGPRASV